MVTVIAIFFLTPSAWALTPDEVVERVSQAYAGVEDLSARFTQTSTMATVGMERVAGGRVAFKRGSMMKWDYEGDDPQQIISDGKVLWFYQKRDRTAIRREVDSLSPAARVVMDILSGLESARSHFNLSSCGDLCLMLEPIVPEPDVERIEVTVDEGGRIASVVTINGLGNTTRVEFSDARVNSGLGEGDFLFTLPEGVDLFDEEEGAR